MMATLSENTIGYNRDRRDILISIGKRRTTLKCNSRRVTERIGTKTVTTQCSELRQVYPSVHAVPITSHDGLGRVTSILEAKCVPAKHDGCQFGQVCSCSVLSPSIQDFRRVISGTTTLSASSERVRLQLLW